MPKNDMNAMLKRRMSAAQQASELQVSDEAYQQIFQRAPPLAPTEICELPLDKLDPFFTADIGFKPYSPSKLKAFAEQLQEEGLLIRIIVRRIPGSDRYEILAGHNRTAAARLAGWTKIAAEVVVADDARATSIAILTNLLQRQDLSIIERGKAYKALLDAKNRQGYRSDLEEGTSGESRQKYSARALVAEFFAVTEYEIRKAIKLTQLIPELQTILEDTPKQLNLSSADLIADYDAASQNAFIEICGIEGYQLNKATVQYIIRKCPPPTADRQNIFAAWREARAEAERRLVAAPKKITFDRKRFAPYLDKLGGEKELESLFLEFLRERLG
ncbi:Nucleoid occlusion protein [uncultured Flavonifractor sp.]|nr:ParB-like partition proteins [Flavonifractor plautii]SCJ47269.1 Nucleoid occlusion protein [uncultured Flavonifractor sp.]